MTIMGSTNKVVPWVASAASAQIRSIIFKNAENFKSTLLKEKTFVKENEESFGIFWNIFCFFPHEIFKIN
jgi:hypothetical protein